MSILVIGNGQSRKKINLSNISIPTIGCNAIFRDYQVNHLICVDKKMIQEALDADANNNSFLYTRENLFTRFKATNLCKVPVLPYTGSNRQDLPEHWGSGPYAILLGATKSKDVLLTGFDLYSKDDNVNNVYKDTLNYSTSDKRAINPSYWIYQIAKIFENFPTVTFTIYQEKNWKIPKLWKTSNVMLDNITNL